MRLPGDKKQSELVQEIIRVNHAGELGAKAIYEGQLKALKRPNEKKLIQEMLDQETKHFEFFDNEIKTRQIRPTLLTPIWHFLGYNLGYLSALLSYKHAMLYTEKVEEVILAHYAKQEHIIDSSETKLKETIKLFKEEEEHHHHTAIENDSQKSFGYIIFGSIIKYSCILAIKIAKKI
jgi:3-demethoxyubiquinol 3-hydroxylase